MIPQLQREAPVSAPEDGAHWSLATRIAFRFAFSYVLLYLSPGAVGSRGPVLQINTVYRRMWQEIWHNVVPWVATHVLHLRGNFTEVYNGSGDQVYDYVLVLCLVLLAAVVTLVWSVLDRKRDNYRVLYQWLRLFMRLAVGAAMIGYGANKIFRAQFPEPPLRTLIIPLAQMSPMGLLWTFMGASRLYSFFAGVGELLGGLILFVPRLTTLGALISFGMMSNVLLLNIGYDVPRKIYSIHLLLMCAFLLLPDLRRLAQVFIFNRPTRAVPETPLFADRPLNFAALLFQFAFGVVVLSIAGHDAYALAKQEATHLPPSIRGIWSVDQFVMDNVSRPPLLTDRERWKDVVFDDADLVTIQSMDGIPQQYSLQLDPAAKFFAFEKLNVPEWKATFRFDDSQPDRIAIDGRMGGHSLSANLHRIELSDPTKFLLLNRGLHWVSPTLYNKR